VEFQQLGNAAITVMAVVGTTCGLAAIGLARNTDWGRRLAVGVLTANVIGDSLNALLRHDPKTLIGLPIGGFMIWFLMKKKASAEK
jgi:H+/Cl- antiporter ClcA